MASFVTHAQTLDPTVPVGELLPPWLLNASAADLPNNLLNELGTDLENHREILASELNFAPNKPLSEGLSEWIGRPGSTLFVLFGALKYIGRQDWVRRVQTVMETRQMQLYVCVHEQGEMDVRYTVSTNCEAPLCSALENALGGDLTHYQIVGPAHWVHWHTKARELKGQQLTLKKLSQPHPHTQLALYGSRVTAASNSKHAITMPPNIPGGDSNYNSLQLLKEHEMEKLKLPVSGSPGSTFSDNQMEEGMSELANPGTAHKEVSLDGFETMTFSDPQEQLTLEENTNQKVPFRRASTGTIKPLVLSSRQGDLAANVMCATPEDNLDPHYCLPNISIFGNDYKDTSSEECERVLDNVPNLSMLQSSSLSRYSTVSKQNDLNGGLTSCSGRKYYSKNCFGEFSDEQRVNVNTREEHKTFSTLPKSCVVDGDEPNRKSTNDSAVKSVIYSYAHREEDRLNRNVAVDNAVHSVIDSYMHKEGERTRSPMDYDSQPSESLDSFSSNSEVVVKEPPLEASAASEMPQLVVHVAANSMHIDVPSSTVPDTDYVPLTHIKKLVSPPLQEVGANKRNTVPSPGSSPNLTRIKRQRSVSDMVDIEDTSQGVPTPAETPVACGSEFRNQAPAQSSWVPVCVEQAVPGVPSHTEPPFQPIQYGVNTKLGMSRSYAQTDPSYRPPLQHTDTQQLDFQNVSMGSSIVPSGPKYSSIAKTAAISGVHYENIPQTARSVEKLHEANPISPPSKALQSPPYDSEETVYTPLMCHTPPPSFPECTATSTAFPAVSGSQVASPMVTASQIRTSQPSGRVQYSNTEFFLAGGNLYPGDMTGFHGNNLQGNRTGNSESQANIVHRRTASSGAVVEERYMHMSRHHQSYPDNMASQAISLPDRPAASRPLPQPARDAGVQIPSHRAVPQQPPNPPLSPPPQRPRGRADGGRSAAGGIYITSGRSPDVYDEASATEDEHYHSIDPQAPAPPPRQLSLEGQLALIPGWSPHVNGSTIQSVMRNHQSVDGNFVIWRSRRMNQFIITVSHLRNLVHYCVREHRDTPTSNPIYFLYNGGFRSDNLVMLVRHYIQSGMQIPVSSGNRSKRYMDHIRLLRPLIVEVKQRSAQPGPK